MMPRSPQTLSRRMLLAASFAAAAEPALAQPAWPVRPLRLIVPFPPGTTPDTLARALAPHLSASLGQPGQAQALAVVVENRPGAAGRVGAEATARATDGHSFGIGNNSSIATAKAMVPNLAYDPLHDLRPVALLVRTPQVLVVSGSTSVATVAAFTEAARRRPGGLSYASIGAGSASHLAMEEFALGAGIQLVHVPYGGFPQAVLDLLAGRIDAMFCPIAAVLPQIAEGRLRGVAVTAETRAAQIPEVPTLGEAGVPNAVSFGWNGLFAPQSTPPAVITRVAEACRTALAGAATRATLERAGFDVGWMGPDAFTDFVATEVERWGGLIQRLGIRADG
ncbi:Bug family tripartite tricarboxylate transporter substrate binding protein [Roseomonas populi]|uniref:Tripartite tricarboxylate transporter substrate binding protein n=1 Tax=Roseomonas populi TaxID=3121582 RepID=A0ABT1XBW9_9PROT|nr:tripartite tricarboxylate transporter substrate binding protein [Roseomonas pecuniae]MCR0985595.1 tripartite tricarboxylate transporter substrate binding protein [Roseomonas pecuniae]